MPRSLWTGAVSFGLVNVPVVDLMDALRQSLEQTGSPRKRSKGGGRARAKTKRKSA